MYDLIVVAVALVIGAGMAVMLRWTMRAERRRDRWKEMWKEPGVWE